MTPDEVGAEMIAGLRRATGSSGGPTEPVEAAEPTAPAEEGSDTAAPVRASVSGGDRFARATVDVPPADWLAAVTTARDELGCDFFDWLCAVDELEAGYTIVAHVWSTTRRHGVLVRTCVPKNDPSVASIITVYPGAGWHERETHEMFGVDFPGHPNLVPLLLPPEFEGHPLRKDFVLAARVAKQWPGAKEPGEREERAPASPAVASERRRGESHVGGTARRAPMRPPGVPAPGEWGPQRSAPAQPPEPSRLPPRPAEEG